MIGCGPGEVLPDIPDVSHGPMECAGWRSSDSKPLLPYNAAIGPLSNIPASAPNNSFLAANPDKFPKTTWNPHLPMPRCMTTSGGQNYHFSGQRPLTHREFAALQGFPHNHEFRGDCVLKQIGNAVPPSMGKILFDAVRESLERSDGVVGVRVEADSSDEDVTDEYPRDTGGEDKRDLFGGGGDGDSIDDAIVLDWRVEGGYTTCREA